MAKRIARVKPVWRVFWDAVGAEQTMSGAIATGANASHDLITAAEVEDLDDNVLLKRVVGEISWWLTPTDGSSALGTMWLHMGMLVEDTQYDASTFTPSAANDAQDAPWLWLRAAYGTGSAQTFEAGNAVKNNGALGGIVSQHIDVKVTRRLRAGDALRLKLNGRAETAAWTINYHVNLRMLLES